ncbi:MAG: hypothetical protein LQ350_003486 [Teloschistes chrysophthalmus]|nr:MAG: hypothetical protein LQ350_003486 [Niorma chrysophthalma]
MPSADLKTASSASSASKPFSISLGTSKAKTAKPTSTSSSSAIQPQNPRKRPHSSLNADSDSETDDLRQRPPQLVSAFDHSAGGAISVNGAEIANEPLVIQGLKNRNWREESQRKRRGKNLLPAEVQAARQQQQNGKAPNGQTSGDLERNEVSTAAGLAFAMKDEDGDTSMAEELRAAQVNGVTLQKEKTVDEEALEALMGDGKRKSTLIIPATKLQATEDADMRDASAILNEDDLFRSDVASRPDPASLDDYARVPVEEFGLGMLRGMGWKEGEVVGKRKDQVRTARVVERRPALLGIGAKEVPGGVGDEFGAWGKVTKGKRKPDKTYNPVVLKNSRTGEMLTEEELQSKKTKQIEEENDWMERRDRNLAIDEERKSDRRRRERERGLDGEGSEARRRSRSRDSRHSSSRRERSRSSDRRHGSSKKHRSKSRERRHHSKRRDDDDDDRREKHRRRERYDRTPVGSPRHGQDSRDEYDDTRRRRHEVY